MGMSRGAWTIAGIGAAAVAAGSAFAGTQYAGRVAVGGQEPQPGGAVASTRPLVAFTATNAGKLTDLKVMLDGRDISKSVGRTDDGRIVVPTQGLAEGSHSVAVTVATRNIFSRGVHSAWDFTVDTTQPKIALRTPATTAVATKSVAFAGTTEPGSKVSVNWTSRGKSGASEATAEAGGAWTTTVDLPEGRNTVRLKVADKAGNVSVRTSAITVDTVAPRLTAAKLPAKLTTDAPLIAGAVGGDAPDQITVGATINGREVNPTRAGEPVEGSAPTVAFTGNKFSLAVGNLPQGKNELVVYAKDRAGNRSEKRYAMLVDSTEELGGKDMVKGARGADVRKLQKSLRERGFKRTKVTGVYDAQTVNAVAKYQRLHKLGKSGVFGVRTREAFVGKIVILIGKRRLQLVRDGKVVRTYRIAVGQPAYPTPTGNYFVVNKESDPTWTPPPDSAWAKGLGPIPPGPGNPLGTRWIGTSAPAVGIHGTNAPSSIGTAASHGCIRMRIPDVEALYEEVSVGMPVQMRA